MSDYLALAFDTSQSPASLALQINDQVFVYMFPGGRQSSQILTSDFVPTLTTFLDQHSLSLDQIGTLATCRGPGSFTGIRIGLSVAQGLSLALNRPVCGLTAFEILAPLGFQEQAQAKHLIALVPSGLGQWYGQVFKDSFTPKDTPHLYTDTEQSALEDPKIKPSSPFAAQILSAIGLYRSASHALPSTLTPAYVMTPAYAKRPESVHTPD